GAHGLAARAGTDLGSPPGGRAGPASGGAEGEPGSPAGGQAGRAGRGAEGERGSPAGGQAGRADGGAGMTLAARLPRTARPAISRRTAVGGLYVLLGVLSL